MLKHDQSLANIASRFAASGAQIVAGPRSVVNLVGETQLDPDAVLLLGTPDSEATRFYLEYERAAKAESTVERKLRPYHEYRELNQGNAPALLAVWLSKRITAPVTALTEATQVIAQGESATLPVTSSDELGTMSQAFNRMTAALETQRELRRRLINDVAHELNTPLSVIQLEARGLRDGLQTPDDASDHIIQEVDRLRGLVTELNWLARLTAAS